MALDLNKIQALIKFVAKSGVSEVDLETKEFKINIKSGPERVVEKVVEQARIETPIQVAVPVQETKSVNFSENEATSQKEKETEDTSNYVTIKSPMIGTFYRSPAPEKPPFITVGDRIEKGNTLCIIEAMKLFNEIEAETSGTIVKVLIDDAKPVEYDQPLFLIDPS